VQQNDAVVVTTEGVSVEVDQKMCTSCANVVSRKGRAPKVPAAPANNAQGDTNMTLRSSPKKARTSATQGTTPDNVAEASEGKKKAQPKRSLEVTPEPGHQFLTFFF
jgi:hypothetical protein